jgi:hypothetical protein
MLKRIEFSGHIFNKYSISNFTKIRQVGAESLRTDRRTDRYDEADGRFLQFTKTP